MMMLMYPVDGRREPRTTGPGEDILAELVWGVALKMFE